LAGRIDMPESLAPSDFVDHESRVTPADHGALKLWLRLLTCTNMIERRIRRDLRKDFASTLPRFDLLAQLQRQPEGLRMRELSLRLMVTSGNITALADQLEAEGLIERLAQSGDKRATLLRLTSLGVSQFAQMAQTHEGWVIEQCAGLSRAEQQALHALLGKLKHGMSTS
jgi:DNA-binding MarR family transcriptional regulator